MLEGGKVFARWLKSCGWDAPPCCGIAVPTPALSPLQVRLGEVGPHVPDTVAAIASLRSGATCTQHAFITSMHTCHCLPSLASHPATCCTSLFGKLHCNARPWTVSWSNVPDYIGPTPEAFHKLARAVSRPGGVDTVHFMHSMNWIRVRRRTREGLEWGCTA